MSSECLALPLIEPSPGLSSCQHRAVSKEGRIVCRKIVEGENQVTPDVCRTCPLKAVNCAHLQFSLRQITPSPLVVRFNGRTEIWDDEPPEVRLSQAACAEKVVPIAHPKQCASCALRQPLVPAGQQPQPRPQALLGEKQKRQRRRVAAGSKVVPFPGRRIAAAAG